MLMVLRLRENSCVVTCSAATLGGDGIYTSFLDSLHLHAFAKIKRGKCIVFWTKYRGSEIYQPRSHGSVCLGRHTMGRCFDIL